MISFTECWKNFIFCYLFLQKYRDPQESRANFAFMYRLLRGFFIGVFLGTEDFVRAVCSILLCCVATLSAIGALEPLRYGSPFLSLSWGSLATASSCHCVLCLAQRGGLLLLREMQWKSWWQQSLLPIPAVPLAGCPGLGWQPISPGSASWAVSSRDLAARSIPWALVQLLCHQLASTVPV